MAACSLSQKDRTPEASDNISLLQKAELSRLLPWSMLLGTLFEGRQLELEYSCFVGEIYNGTFVDEPSTDV